MTKKETTTGTTLTRDNLRALATELNQLGIKEIMGFAIKSGSDKAELQKDIEDAVREIFQAQRNKDFAKAIQRPGAQAAWDTLALRFITTAQHKAAIMREANGVAKRMSLEKVSESVADMIVKDSEKKKSAQAGTGGKSSRTPKGSMWSWLRVRLENASLDPTPATRSNLLLELMHEFPNVKERTLRVFLYGARTPKFNKTGVNIVEDENQLYSITE